VALVIAALATDACDDVCLTRLQSVVVCGDLDKVSLDRWKEEATYSERDRKERRERNDG